MHGGFPQPVASIKPLISHSAVSEKSKKFQKTIQSLKFDFSKGDNFLNFWRNRLCMGALQKPF